MAWKIESGTAQKPETVSEEVDDQTGEKRSIYRYPVPGGWLYEFVNERRGNRFESVTFVPGESDQKKGFFKK